MYTVSFAAWVVSLQNVRAVSFASCDAKTIYLQCLWQFVLVFLFSARVGCFVCRKQIRVFSLHSAHVPSLTKPIYLLILYQFLPPNTNDAKIVARNCFACARLIFISFHHLVEICFFMDSKWFRQFWTIISRKERGGKKENRKKKKEKKNEEVAWGRIADHRGLVFYCFVW